MALLLSDDLLFAWPSWLSLLLRLFSFGLRKRVSSLMVWLCAFARLLRLLRISRLDVLETILEILHSFVVRQRLSRHLTAEQRQRQ